MNLLKRVSITLGVIVVGVTAAYRYVLRDDQRDALREAGNAIRTSMQEVTDSVAPLRQGVTKAEERAMAEENRAKTAAQWKDLGF